MYPCSFAAIEDVRFICLFCKGVFDSLAYYACCAHCYSTSATVRLLVDVSTPQTDSATTWLRVRDDAERAS